MVQPINKYTRRRLTCKKNSGWSHENNYSDQINHANKIENNHFDQINHENRNENNPSDQIYHENNNENNPSDQINHLSGGETITHSWCCEGVYENGIR